MRSGILDTGRSSNKKRSPRLRRKKVQSIDAVPKDSNKNDTNVDNTLSVQNDISTAVDASEPSTNLNGLPADVMNVKVQEWVDNQNSDCNSTTDEVQLPMKTEACSVEVSFF